MGCKSSSGLLSLTACLILTAVIGCRGKGPAPADPSLYFTQAAEGVSRTLGIYSGGRRVGTHQTSRIRGVWNGSTPAVQLVERTELNLSFRDQTFTIRTEQDSFLDAENLDLLAAVSEIDFGGQAWKTRWIRESEGRYRKIESLGGREHSEIQAVPSGVPFMEALNLILDRLDFDHGEGRSRRMSLYNMTLERSLPVDISWKGRQGPHRGFVISVWGMEEEVWLDDDGLVVRETMSWGGIDAHAPAPDEIYGTLSLERVFAQTLVPAKGVPESLGELDSAVLVLEGVQETPPQTHWQRVVLEDGRVTVSLERPKVPVEGGEGVVHPGSIPGDEVHLSLNDPRIQALAEEITGGLKDPWEKSRAIGVWVYQNLGKSMRESLTAVEALEAGEGECQSHSLLAVALYRAAGIPARFLYGAVYMPDRGGFLFHTWVDVHVGGWIPMDPTLGHFPAGVDHLVLGMGGYIDQFQVFPYILGGGRWSIAFKEGEGEGK